ncbi:MAG: PAS domain S-box protein [Ignavibacteriales bacterium]|nr:PAS domain S-box protein [Ignavibacteriales bacterium]
MEKSPSYNDAERLRRLAEPKVKIDESEVENYSSEDIRRLLHDLRSHQVELELQNDELRAARDRVEKSRAQFADLYHEAPVGFISINEGNAVLEANRTAATLLEIELEQLIGKPITRFLAESSHKAYHQFKIELFVSELKNEVDLDMTTYKGRTFSTRFHAVSQPIDSNDNRVARVVFADTTSERASNERIAQNERRLRMILDSAYEGVAVVRKGVFVYGNRRMLEFAEYLDDEEFSDVPFHTLVHPEDLERVTKRLVARLKNETLEERFRFRGVGKRGSVRWLETSSTLVEWDGEPSVLVFITDVSAEMQSERILRENEEKYRALFENASEAILLMTNVILDCNPRATAFLQRAREEILGRAIWDFSPPTQPDGRDSREAAESYIEAAMGGMRQSFTWRHSRPDGSTVEAEVRLTSIEIAGRPMLLAALRDITERLEDERRLREYADALQRISDDKSRLLSIIAHDVRTPFNAVVGYAEYLVEELDGLSTDEIRKIVSGLYRSAGDVYSLLENLLDWARLQSEGINAKPTTIGVRRVFEETAKLYRALAERRSVNLTIECENAVVVFGDRQMLSSIVRNLLSNALKFSEPGGNVSISAAMQQGKTRIVVADEGVGMTDSQRERLFGKDAKPVVADEKRRGAGIGLTVCKEFVELLGGEIFVESELDKGSVFTVILPASDE